MSDSAPTPPAPQTLTRAQQERRTALRSLAVGAGVTCAALAGLLRTKLATGAPRLRPPGAIDEDAFLAACIKCGQCVQVCPVQAIELADLIEGLGSGAPYIAARAQACDFSCDAVQCVLACPTGALTHKIDKKEQVRIGVAELAAPDRCLARKGQGFKGPARGVDHAGKLRYPEIDRWKPKPVAAHPYDLDLCDLCVRQCPIEGAISLQPAAGLTNDKARTPVVTDKCVGCGVCEMICPAEPAAIRIAPRVTGRHPA
ncbi:MAG: 4Fe-4S dicluster domain-containing protein [Rhizobiales bacterium]|nr:4Fe-4S dicluster domain-containing protein [Hyphomicrobiales bacterium]